MTNKLRGVSTTFVVYLFYFLKVRSNREQTAMVVTFECALKQKFFTHNFLTKLVNLTKLSKFNQLKHLVRKKLFFSELYILNILVNHL